MMLRTKKAVKVSIPEVVGKGYGDFWKCKQRYRVVKGSRGSKKSKTTALWIISSMMCEKYKEANVLVVRRYQNTLRDSCYSDLIWAMEKLKVRDSFECTVSPMKITYKPFGNVILFRGLDEGTKVTSISVPH